MEKSWWAVRIRCAAMEFLEQALEQNGNQAIPKADKQLFITLFKKLSHELSNLPQCLVHRDFQSKNILVENL